MRKFIYILLLLVSTTLFAQETKTVQIENVHTIQAHPNPFANKTEITFFTEEPIVLYLDIQDILGNIVFQKKIKTDVGVNYIPFFKNKLSKGIYLYTLKTDNQLISKRLVIK